MLLRHRSTWFCIALLTATLAAYSNHFGNGFHFDDSHTVVDNTHIRKLANVPRFFADPSMFSVLPTHQVYRPVVSTSLALDYWVGGGLKPWAFHVGTFGFYCLLLVSMFLLCRRMTGGHDLVALFATAIFALHPVSAETVNYVIQRADLYATLGVVAGLLLYVAKPGLRRYGLYLVPFLFAALSKPPALVFPVLLLIYVRLFENRTWTRSARATAGAWAATAGIALFLSRMVGPGFAPGGGDRLQYWATQTWVTFEYFLAFFWPARLSADSDEGLISGLSVQAAVGVTFVVLLLIVVIRLAKDPAWRPVSFGLAWFLIALAPTAAVPLAEVANDHRMFMPFVGLSLAASWTAFRLLQHHRRTAVVASAVVLLAAGCATHARNQVWRTEETLWRDVTIKSPLNGRGWMNYGLTLMGRSDNAGALACFERAALYTPNYSLLEINTGIVKGVLGRHADAERHFQRALALAPAQAASHFFYGRWLMDRGRYIDAASRFESTLRISPGDLAAKQYMAKLAAASSPEEYLNLSLAHYRAGRYEACAQAARQALALRPGYADALNNIAAAYNAMHRWDEGIAAAEQAVRLDASNQLARNNLAWARAEKGRTIQ